MITRIRSTSAWVWGQFADGPYDCVWWMKPMVGAVAVWLLLLSIAALVAFLLGVIAVPLWVLETVLSWCA